jgi:hypothetical protein
VTAVGDFLFRAEHGFFKLECDVFAEIGAALRACTTSGTTASTEQIPEAEEFPEYVVEILEDGCIKSRSGPCAAYPRVPEPIVKIALLRVGEDGVGFAALLEFFFRVRIIGIAVGMILER